MRDGVVDLLRVMTGVRTYGQFLVELDSERSRRCESFAPEIHQLSLLRSSGIPTAPTLFSNRRFYRHFVAKRGSKSFLIFLVSFDLNSRAAIWKKCLKQFELNWRLPVFCGRGRGGQPMSCGRVCDCVGRRDLRKNIHPQEAIPGSQESLSFVGEELEATDESVKNE
jgi:hypothetical protein